MDVATTWVETTLTSIISLSLEEQVDLFSVILEICPKFMPDFLEDLLFYFHLTTAYLIC